MPDSSPDDSHTTKPIGSTWMGEKRACDDCGNKHHGLVDWTDGSKTCMACQYNRMKGRANAR